MILICINLYIDTYKQLFFNCNLINLELILQLFYQFYDINSFELFI